MLARTAVLRRLGAPALRAVRPALGARPQLHATSIRALSTSIRALSTTRRAESATEVCEKMGVDHHEGALESLFLKLDSDGDGLIQPSELRSGLENAGLAISDAALVKLTETYGDASGNMEVANLLDLLSAVKDHKFHSFEEEPDAEECEAPVPETPHYVFSDVGHFEGAIDLAFSVVDKNGDGLIDKGELMAALSARGLTVSREEIHHLFALYDSKGNGRLELVDFASLCANLTR